ncbi:MAG: fasciclin domain-containing protein [Chloroflexi bacterium]|nr:fasciclin domain-containing protein [Chloroflexota bacterium]
MTFKHLAVSLVLAVAALLAAAVDAAVVQAQTSQTIMDYISDDPTLSRMELALGLTDLDDTYNLDSDTSGPFTVFVPDNNAWDTLNAAFGEDFDIFDDAANGYATLEYFTRFHIVVGEYDASDLNGLTTIESELNNQDIYLQDLYGELFVHGAIVLDADIELSNGTIHIVDTVNMPVNIPPEKEPTTVQFQTPFALENDPAYWDLGVVPGYYLMLGLYNKFNYDGDFTLTWQPYEFDSTNGAYRIAIREYDPVSSEVYVERKVAYHWDSNPNNELFVYGAFGWGEVIWMGSPHYIVIEPAEFSTYVDAGTGITEYAYDLIDSATPQWSDVFSYTLDEALPASIYDFPFFVREPEDAVP